MWQYVFAHICYHMSRMFPQNNRVKINVFLVKVALLLPVGQIYVIFFPYTSGQYCAQPLLNMAIASLVFTFFAIGFVILFLLMIPVPRAVKIVFHVFGLGTFAHGLAMIILTYMATEDCATWTTELYILCAIQSWLSAASIVFAVIMLPFWVINKAKKDVVLDPYSRTGLCYEPVKCCKCLWHI